LLVKRTWHTILVMKLYIQNQRVKCFFFLRLRFFFYWVISEQKIKYDVMMIMIVIIEVRKIDHPGEARMTCGRSPHHGEAMTWLRSDHHPGFARMTCGQSPHHGFAMTFEKLREIFEKLQNLY
jgi:hypothetical protein